MKVNLLTVPIIFNAVLMIECASLLPIVNFDEFKCINYFWRSQTNTFRYAPSLRLGFREQKTFELDYRILVAQIGNVSIPIKVMRWMESQFDDKFSFLLFISSKKHEFTHRFSESVHIFEGNVFFPKEQNAVQIFNQKFNSNLFLFSHLNYHEKRALFQSIRTSDLNGIAIFIIGECFVRQNNIIQSSKVSTSGQVLRVMSPNLPPFTSYSQDGSFYSGIEYNLLQLISQKLKKPIQYKYLSSRNYHDILQQIIHGNLSEAFIRLDHVIFFQIISHSCIDYMDFC